MQTPEQPSITIKNGRIKLYCLDLVAFPVLFDVNYLYLWLRADTKIMPFTAEKWTAIWHMSEENFR